MIYSCLNTGPLDMLDVPVHPALPASLEMLASHASNEHHQGWAALWQWFCRRKNLLAPELTQLRSPEVPQPYRSLLVHSSDMTPTLEQYFGQDLGLTVLSRHMEADSYFREVLLHIGEEQRPVLYGVIRILLNHLPEAAKNRVLEEIHPLGHILITEGVGHLSWPQAFFRTKLNPQIKALLGIEGAPVLYGRRNVLVDGSRRLLAEVIEVLAPVEEREAGGHGVTDNGNHTPGKPDE